jgi:hypothetical protein
LAHLGDKLDDYLDRLRPGDDIDVRGAVVDGDRVAQVLHRVNDGGVVAGAVRFEHAEIAALPVFPNLTFEGPVRCEHARFVGQVLFTEVTFRVDANFDDAMFGGTATFDNVKANGTLSFDNARFEKRTWIGPLTAAHLNLDRARCAAMTEVDVRVESLTCQLARFEEGVAVRADGGEIRAKQARFGAPSLISGTGALPKLRSLRATDVGNLELADVDLRWCAFAGAQRLDQLRLAGHCSFDHPPRGWRTRRRTIVEELAWREWPSDRPVRWGLDSVEPERMANVFRSLRKASEDSKNEPGAGDFYYGEMEMRRHSAETPRAERWILAVYWLLSGYGQRAARAVAALAVVIAVVGVLLALWGQPPADAARIAVGAVVLRDPGAKLTAAGQWTVMVARVLGPVLLALAVLAIRARVKR